MDNIHYVAGQIKRTIILKDIKGFKDKNNSKA